MYEFAIIWDWLAFAVRWLHVITGIAWIGSSFYFVALDLGLKKVPHLPPGAYGEEWQVHGGGFYHIQKYLVAPERMPEHLVWFKWESYATWLSGFAMLAIVYYAGADLFLVDRTVLDIPAWAAILISLASLRLGWLLYDNLCKSRLAKNPTTLMVILFLILVAMAWGYTHVFTGRAALLHLGAFTATIMSANVFLVIIPNQTIVVADLKAGRTPDPKYGAIAKLRSTHNNYLTLPVLFLMLSQPLSAGLRHRVELADRQPGVPDGRDHPALFQHHARDRQGPELDLGGDGDHLRHHHVAVERAGQPARGAGGAVADGAALRQRRGLHGGGGHGARALLDVPHRRAGLAGRAPRAEGRDARHRRRDRGACPRDLPAGRAQPRDAAGQRHRDRAGGAPAIVDWYRGAVSG